MATKHTKVNASPGMLAQWRPIERIKPGWWWLGTYTEGGEGDEDGGETVEMWTEASWIMEGQQIATGRKTVRVYGICTDGEPAELGVYRGTQVYTLTERDGRRCGLKIAESRPDEAEQA